VLTSHHVEDLKPLGDDLRTDAVAGDDSNPDALLLAHGSTLRDRPMRRTARLG